MSDQEIEDDKKNWLMSPYTRHMAKELERHVGDCLGFVLQSAAVSSDPKVAQAFAAYDEARKLLLQIKGPQ